MNLWQRIKLWMKPTMEPNPAKIAICVGHSRPENGRPEGGAVSVGRVQEWTYNGKLAVMIQDKLLELGIKSFIVDRYQGNGYTDSMKWLASHLQAEHATHAIELHFNSATPGARGHEFLYWHESQVGQDIAIALSKKFKEWFPQLTSRGPKSRTSTDRGGEFLRLTKCPCVILEPFFGSNTEDWAFASNTDNQYLMAGAIARAIKESITQDSGPT